MLSMDQALVESRQSTQIRTSLRDDAKHMAPKRLQGVLNAEWQAGRLKRFRYVDQHPFAVALIKQVHGLVMYDGQDLAIEAQYPSYMFGPSAGQRIIP